MNAENFQEGLQGLLDYVASSDEVLEMAEMEALDGANILTFDQAGLLTGNKGIVIRFANGDEFQLSIVQSKRGIVETDEDE
jgi:hypothetical protein